MEDLRRRVQGYLLQHAGVAEGEVRVLEVAAARPVGLPPGGELILVGETSGVAVIRENLDVNERGFDPAAPAVTEGQAEGFRAQLRGAAAVTLRVEGRAVSAGMMLPVHDGVTELTGIATLAAYRGRGCAQVVTAALVEVAGARGAEVVFVRSVRAGLYARVGFRSL
ncbi:GNAT family N-acetyltransferase [Paractinoplanes abujensis]|uniref:Ribosomal protein S18 acetylase RimI-like enzyme n=1 Tax=Paractinoplanes abujensis TaxID=882441 RepID=A0A7W7CM99_9ACTN|nr:GNAT family N-acetyltransferase [Actinoplanes abujensis]MBB4691123.1 ribosomal protein S18 acetylase RimI-like enzyme [Actinoplanes abujensis]